MIRRVVLCLQQLFIGEPQQLHMPIQEISGQESIVQESLEQRELSSKLVIGRGSVNVQVQESTTEESCEQRDLSSKLISRRGSVEIQGQKLTTLIQ